MNTISTSAYSSMAPSSDPSRAMGTFRRGLSVAPAGTGTYSNPVQANSPASPPRRRAVQVDAPPGGGSDRRCGATKKSPTATKPSSGNSFAPLKKSLATAPGLTPRQLRRPKATTTQAARAPWASGAEKAGNTEAGFLPSARATAPYERTTEANAIQPTANPIQSPKARRAYA